MDLSGAVVLQANNASKSYGGEFVLRDVSLSVRAGEVHALVGLNGAGKTTLMRLFLGMARPDIGTVLVRGREPASMASQYWAGIGHLLEAPPVYPELTVVQNLQVAGRLAGLGTKPAAEAANRMMSELALTRWARTRTRNLSGGNRQRLGLAAALIADPAVLILDEPTNALDPAGVLAVRRILLERSRQGTATLLSSHYLDEVSRIADRITVMNSGRLIGTIEPTAVDLERKFFELVYGDDEVAR